MKKQNVLILGLLLTVNNVSALNSENEWQINRLFSPSYEELQSEFVFGTITNYINIPENIINLALDQQFSRIEFMNFSEEVE